MLEIQIDAIAFWMVAKPSHQGVFCGSGDSPRYDLSKGFYIMRIKTLAAASIMAVASVTPVKAVTYTHENVDYVFSTISGSFSGNSVLLERQFWFGDGDLVTAVAERVGEDLLSKTGVWNIEFAARTDGTVPGNLDVYAASAVYVRPLDRTFIGFGAFSASTNVIFAVATPVSAIPLPASALLLMSGLGGIAVFNRSKKRAKPRDASQTSR